MDINHYFSALSNFSIGSITLSNLLPALLVLAVCLLAKRMLMKLVDRAIDASRIDLSLRAFLRSAVNIGLLILTALIVADKLGIPVTSLIAALGVAGLAVSLAVQGTLSNIAGGIMLLLSKPFAVGDYIEAGGVSGTVREIGLNRRPGNRAGLHQARHHRQQADQRAEWRHRRGQGCQLFG